MASSNWRETAKTRARARSAEAELASANETIRTLQAKMMLVETKLGGEKRQLADEGAKLRDVIAEDTARHDARLDAAKRDHDARYDELAERHARARAELASLHSTLGRAAGGARGVTDLDTELQTEREAMHRDALERLEHTLRSEAAHAYETLEKAKDAQIKNLKEQSEYFLSAKDREIGELRRRADARERETTAETARLNAQVEYLHRWALAMNQIIRKVEDGSYRVAERAGARTLAIPARELPKSLDVRILADRADAARAFLEEIGGGADGAARSEGAARGGADDDAAYLPSPRRTRGTRSSWNRFVATVDWWTRNARLCRRRRSKSSARTPPWSTYATSRRRTDASSANCPRSEGACRTCAWRSTRRDERDKKTPSSSRAPPPRGRGREHRRR